MKKFIISLEKDWIAFLFGVVGVLLIIFPKEFTTAAPFILGIGLILKGIVGIVILCKYKSETKVKLGGVVIDIVLGGAILYHYADAIGVLGAMWAMISLYEAAEEITESYEKKEFSVIRIIVAVITIGLAILLLFSPFEHFETHVRILGLELLASLFIRRHKLIRQD